MAIEAYIGQGLAMGQIIFVGSVKLLKGRRNIKALIAISDVGIIRAFICLQVVLLYAEIQARSVNRVLSMLSALFLEIGS